MKKFLAAIVCLLSLAGSAAAQETLVLPIRQREVCDLVTNFTMSQTVAAGNAAKFNAATAASRTNRFPFTVPGGKLPLDATLNAPGRTGWSLLGNGYGSKLHDNGFTDSAAQATGGAPSRLVWKGADGGTMIADGGNYHSYQGLHLQSRDIPGNGGTDKLSWISGATNATPIVVTTEFQHGLTDGDVFRVRKVTGNTAANGDWYADVLTATTIALYEDQSLTTPVAGNGTYSNASGTAFWSGPEARIGIHVLTAQLTPGNVSTGKHVFRDLSFAVPIGMLFGKNMSQAYQMQADYDGEQNGHADECAGDNLRFHYPFYLADDEERTAIYFRNEQAVGHHIGKMVINGCPNEGIYVERAGVLTVDQITLNGNTPRGLLRIGNLQNLPVKINDFNVDGGGDQAVIGRSTMLLNMDRHGIGGQVYMRGKYRPAYHSNGEWHATQVPQYVCRGACYVELEVDGLIPNSIRMIGQSFSTGGEQHRRLAHVHLRSGCKLYHTNDPTDLIAESGNVAPYLLTWDEGIESYQINVGGTIMENQPIRGGEYSSQMGDVPWAGE